MLLVILTITVSVIICILTDLLTHCNEEYHKYDEK